MKKIFVLFLIIFNCSCAPIYVSYDFEKSTDFSIYKTRSPHWDKYARAVLQPIIGSLELNGFKARITTVKTNQGV